MSCVFFVLPRFSGSDEQQCFDGRFGCFPIPLYTVPRHLEVLFLRDAWTIKNAYKLLTRKVTIADYPGPVVNPFMYAVRSVAAPVATPPAQHVLPPAVTPVATETPQTNAHSATPAVTAETPTRRKDQSPPTTPATPEAKYGHQYAYGADSSEGEASSPITGMSTSVISTADDDDDGHSTEEDEDPLEKANKGKGKQLGLTPPRSNTEPLHRSRC